MGTWRGWAAAALLTMVGTTAGMALAQTPEQSVVDQLSRQGYVDFEVSRTLLGRVRVVAQGPDGVRREIVFNPTTGEILRDFVEDAGAGPRVLDRPAGRSGGDDDDDDDDERDDDDDRSGSGGGSGGGSDDDDDRDDDDRDDDGGSSGGTSGGSGGSSSGGDDDDGDDGGGDDDDDDDDDEVDD